MYKVCLSFPSPLFITCNVGALLTDISCALIWIQLPIRCYAFTKRTKLPRFTLNVAKLTVNCLLSLLLIFKSTFVSDTNFMFENIRFQAPTSILTSILIYFDSKIRLEKSTYLIYHWVLLGIAGIFTITSNLLNKWKTEINRDDIINFIMFIVYYLLILVQLILSTSKNRMTTDTKMGNLFKIKSYITSHLTFGWFNPIMWKGIKKTLKGEDVFQPFPQLETNHSVSNLIETINRHKAKYNQISIGWVLLKCHRPQIIKAFLFYLSADLFVYSNPLLLKQFYALVNADGKLWPGLVYVLSIFACTLIASILTRQAEFQTKLIMCGVRSSLISFIYQECFKLKDIVKYPTGEFINMISVDVHRISEFINVVMYSTIYPLQVSILFSMLYNLIGVAAFSGLIVLIFIKIVSAIIAKFQEAIEVRQLNYKIKRIKFLAEAISGIKVIKCFTWENSFIHRINRIRQLETDAIKYCLILKGVSRFMWGCGPIMLTMAMFSTYILIDSNNVLDVEKIFITLAIVGIIQVPMQYVPKTIANFVQARVSIDRLNAYINHTNNVEKVSKLSFGDDAAAIAVVNTTFIWSKNLDEPNSTFSLQNICLKIKKGQLVALVGPVNSGKSSLLSALLGEMIKKNGFLQVTGRVAYVSQQAWVQTGSIKENILFGKKYNKKKYDDIIKCCDLETDLMNMAAGDDTNIEENGANISGGQKQRICLARAIYYGADVYLLDDPLSALDANVERNIFEKVIGPKGILRQKVRVIATHSLSYLSRMNYVVVLDNGKIINQGTYNELINSSRAFSELIKEYTNTEELTLLTDSNEFLLETNNAKSENSQKENNKSKLILKNSKEQMEFGNVKTSTYLSYLFQFGHLITIGAAIFAVVAFAFAGGVEIWLRNWSTEAEHFRYQLSQNQTKIAKESNYSYLHIYLILASSQCFCFMVFMMLIVIGSTKACWKYHQELINSVIKCPMRFFDTTPSGQILNRFSKDIDVVDGELPINFQEGILATMEIFKSTIIICTKMPIFMLIAFPIFVCVYLIQRCFVRTMAQLRRLESVTQSPIYTKFSETLWGLSTIRAFKKKKYFIKKFDKLLDENMKYAFNVRILVLWASLRWDLIKNAFITLTVLFALLYKNYLGTANVALLVDCAVLTSSAFIMLIWTMGTLENNIISVERLNEYIALPSEGPWNCPEVKLKSTWPLHGKIKFNNFSAQYGHEFPVLLKQMHFSIKCGEKIGIIGRTGAGKSTIAMALLRFIETTRGNIIIDGEDIFQIGLHDLRSRITIIPQEPTLFSDSLRFNLDPCNKYSDDEIWKALHSAHLSKFVSAAGLDQRINEKGSNLSVGQKQLVCLARALLKKSKILILDEATASVDSETDALIQSTIKTEFKDSTVLIITHRFNNFDECNRLIIVKNGEVKLSEKKIR